MGGNSTPINITPIAQTTPTDIVEGVTRQGNLAAIGTAGFSDAGFTKSFTEHGVLIGFVNARADLTYQQGLNKMFSRSTRYDFYFPALAQIGEQAVLSKEIYADGSSADNDVFGYQERWAEMRYKPSLVTTVFRSASPQPLDAWHLALDFDSRPLLNDAFIQDDAPLDRCIAVPTEPHFIGDFYHKAVWARPMPLYGVPGMIDHF